MIYIYNGPGTSPICVNAIRKTVEGFLEEEAATRILETADTSYLTDFGRMWSHVLIMPGGNALTYCQQFSEDKRRKISILAKDGLIKYLGICAGALFAGEDFLSITKTQSAWGCHAKSQIKECRDKEKQLQRVKIFDPFNRKSLQIIWWCGSAFKPETIGYTETIVADYERIDDSPHKTAVLRPLPNVFLSHVHPEFQSAGLVDSLDGLPAEDKDILSRDAQSVREWFQDQCARIGICKRASLI